MKTFLTLVLAAIMFSCSTPKSYFTTPLRKKLETNINKIQFYNDIEIVLEYKTSVKNEQIKSGKVEFKEGYYYYYITIPKETFAVAKSLDKERLMVYFETGNDRFLVFGDNVKDNDDFYQLYGSTTGNAFYVVFEGKNFKVIKGANAKLQIKKNLKVNVNTDERKVKGVKIGK